MDGKFQMLELEEVISVEELDGDPSKVVVFDDIKIDSSHETYRGILFLVQKPQLQLYLPHPELLRRPQIHLLEYQSLLSFHGLDNKDIWHIADDHSKATMKNLPIYIYIYMKAS